MTEADVLDIFYRDDARVEADGKYPIPAVLDYQGDYLAIYYMLG